MTYPDGEVVTTAYNNLMQPNSLIGDNTYEANAAYDSAGRMISRTLGNGLKSTFTYNAWNTAAGRLKKITSGTLQDLAYTYDAVGNILGITDAKSGETQSYTYDSLDRLTGWKMNGIVKELYGYNASTGNLTTSGGATLTYGEPSHDHAVTAMGSNTYSYDANGNQKARTIAGVTYSLGYDAENRMVSVSSSGLNASFVYDGDGRRVKSTINGVVTTFIGNHYEVSTGMLSKYYFLGGARVAMRQAGLIYYPLTDHLGSTTLTTDESGAVVSELRYTAWGKTRFTSGSTPTKYQFTGQYSNEPDFGLIYFNARWYDPGINRFSSPDSLVPDTYNTLDYDRYMYSRANPIKYSDPSGHRPCGDGEKADCSGESRIIKQRPITSTLRRK
ncbi:MAG: RHS repeat-associated core domain-containing protein [Chloroflexota bacterium]